MRKLILLLAVALIIPSVQAFTDDGKEPIYGWNWNNFSEVEGNWKVIGNRTILSHIQYRRQEALMRIDADIPENLTELSIGFELTFPYHVAKHNVTLTNIFYLDEYGPNQVAFLVSYTRRKKTTWFFGGRERYFKIRVWHPATGSWVEILNLFFDSGEGTMDRFQFAYKLMADGNYLIQCYVEVLRYELLASDLNDPADYAFMSQRSTAFGLYTYRTYRIYSAVEMTTDPLHSPSNVTWKMSKNSEDNIGVEVQGAIHNDLTWFVNNTYVEGDDDIMDAVGRINLLERLVYGAGEGFRALRLRAVGNWLMAMSVPVGTVADSVLFVLPFIFGMYGIFVFAIVMKAFSSGDMSIIVNHFLGIYHFLASLIGRVLSLFWGVIGAISAAPFGNLIIAFIAVGILLYIGISI